MGDRFCCLACDEQWRMQQPTFSARVATRMIVCPDCGNKRCPKASSHVQGCTRSNEPGQPGSWYH